MFWALVIAAVANADKGDFSWHVAGYVVGKVASGAGYTPGVGGMLELYGRWKFLELKLNGAAYNMRKKAAENGYTYGYTAEIRRFFYGPFYGLVATSLGGYHSEFANGAVWEKRGRNQGIGLGYSTEETGTDVNLSYYFQENTSPNRVQYTTLAFRQRIYKLLYGMVNITRQTYDQMTATGIERWDGVSISWGLGIRW